ncbi:MAG TPA: DUF4252 domain-containing protein [Puia sp.]|jgi:hypothetical protein|nr:DUF4252 domain-containing protein [Puia sp.]
MNLIKYRTWALLLSLLLVGRAGFAQDDAIGKFFGRYLDDDRFTVVSISPKMFRLMAKVNWDTVSPDMKQTVSKLQSLRILSTSTTPMVFYKEALARIDRKEYEELITVRSSKDNVHFMVKENGNTITELLMISVDEDEFTLVSFVGDIDLNKLSKLSSDMGIKGMENLKNVKRK